MTHESSLNRSISRSMLVVYGVGTIVGGGFYALIGKVAESSGVHMPLSFLLACALALLSAFSFAELSSRFPRSAGESFYVLQAFKSSKLATFVGWLVVLTGVVSAATLSVAVGEFLEDLFAIPSLLGRVLCVGFLTAVAYWGVMQSVILAGVITALELIGLMFIICAGFWFSSPLSELSTVFSLSSPELAFSGISAGAFLAFYSFIGFEDMVNMAEEVRDPQRSLPSAIIVTVLISGLLYFLTGLVALSAVPVEQLVESQTPLALVASKYFEGSAAALGVVSVLAGVNGALVQIVMAARVLYGMASESMAPKLLAKVSSSTRTPHIATAAAGAAVLILALGFSLTALAKVTSGFILFVFSLVNLSLIAIRLRESVVDKNCFRVPLFIPVLGLFCSLAFLLANLLLPSSH